MASGELNPQCLYSTDRLAELGFGEWLLRKVRRDGVKPIKVGRQSWYRGKELCEWVEQQAEKVGSQEGA